ncbi:hypothetical protein HK096_005590 [Nowakowskiella sp. JEL0078]|nr:hypothetical protein HK096_005590 [Nowakowskiella sp. JEL0078]
MLASPYTSQSIDSQEYRGAVPSFAKNQLFVNTNLWNSDSWSSDLKFDDAKKGELHFSPLMARNFGAFGDTRSEYSCINRQSTHNTNSGQTTQANYDLLDSHIEGMLKDFSFDDEQNVNRLLTFNKLRRNSCAQSAIFSPISPAIRKSEQMNFSTQKPNFHVGRHIRPPLLHISQQDSNRSFPQAPVNSFGYGLDFKSPSSAPLVPSKETQFPFSDHSTLSQHGLMNEQKRPVTSIDRLPPFQIPASRSEYDSMIRMNLEINNPRNARFLNHDANGNFGAITPGDFNYQTDRIDKRFSDAYFSKKIIDPRHDSRNQNHLNANSTNSFDTGATQKKGIVYEHAQPTVLKTRFILPEDYSQDPASASSDPPIGSGNSKRPQLSINTSTSVLSEKRLSTIPNSAPATTKQFPLSHRSLRCKRALDRMHVPLALECFTCNATKPASEFSKSQVRKAQFAILVLQGGWNSPRVLSADPNKPYGSHFEMELENKRFKPICKDCTPSQNTINWCALCELPLSRSKFSKSQRKSGEMTRCISCIRINRNDKDYMDFSDDDDDDDDDDNYDDEFLDVKKEVGSDMLKEQVVFSSDNLTTFTKIDFDDSDDEDGPRVPIRFLHVITVSRNMSSQKSQLVYGVRPITSDDLKNYERYGVEIPNSAREGETGVYRSSTAPNLVVDFPNIKTVFEGFQAALHANGNNNCLGHRPILEKKMPANDDSGSKVPVIRWGAYVWQTFRQVSDRRINFGCGLVKIHRDFIREIDNTGKWKVGIFSVNRPEWTITELAANAFSLITVPLYETLGPDAVEYVINHSELNIVVCSIDKVAGLLQSHGRFPHLKVIVSMDSLSEGGLSVAGKQSTAPGEVLRKWAAERGVLLFAFEEVEALGLKNRIPLRPPKAEDIITICYTSGTTGNPKGAMMMHKNLISVVRAAVAHGTTITKDDVFISYLPLAHIMERAFFTNVLVSGGSIGFSRGDVALLMEDIALLRPTLFISVPRLLNRIYDRIIAQTINGPSPLRAALFKRALDAKTANLEATGNVTHPFWDRIVFNKVKVLLGGRLRFILSGSAPISPEILTFLRVCFCTQVVEGYGQTESTASTAIQWLTDISSGSVGPAFPCNEIKLASIPEMGYSVLDKPYPRGEVLLRGANVFKGYLKDEAKTRETMTEDGWLKTGDIGLIDDKGKLTLIDRKKNIFKLAQGEYVAPEKIENIYSKCTRIAQIYVHGDSLQSELVAVVVPDFEVAVPEAKAKGWISSSVPDVVAGAIPEIESLAN